MFFLASHGVEDLLDEQEGSKEQGQPCEDVLNVANWQKHFDGERGVLEAGSEVVDEVGLVVLEN